MLYFHRHTRPTAGTLLHFHKASLFVCFNSFPWLCSQSRQDIAVFWVAWGCWTINNCDLQFYLQNHSTVPHRQLHTAWITGWRLQTEMDFTSPETNPPFCRETIILAAFLHIITSVCGFLLSPEGTMKESTRCNNYIHRHIMLQDISSIK